MTSDQPRHPLADPQLIEITEVIAMGRSRRRKAIPKTRVKSIPARESARRAARRRMLRELAQKPLSWLAAIGGAMVIAAATAFGTGYGQHLFDATSSRHMYTGLPVMIDSVTSDNDQSSGTYMFAGPLILTARALTYLNTLSPSDPRYDSWFTSRGGAPSFNSIIKLVVEGNRPYSVQIIDMGVLDHCGRPLTGTVFYNLPNGGTVGDLGINFDLDEARPFPQNGLAAGSYFSSHSVFLNQGEHQVFTVVSGTSSHYCTYELTLTVVDGTKTLTETVTDHGQPFRVTAGLPFSQYKVLYLGGQQAGQSAPFIRKNPSAYKGNSPA
jgi:hypothetical protein